MGRNGNYIYCAFCFGSGSIFTTYHEKITGRKKNLEKYNNLKYENEKLHQKLKSLTRKFSVLDKYYGLNTDEEDLSIINRFFSKLKSIPIKYKQINDGSFKDDLLVSYEISELQYNLNEIIKYFKEPIKSIYINYINFMIWYPIIADKLIDTEKKYKETLYASASISVNINFIKTMKLTTTT